jgi:flagellar biosynthesis/type III secretory pathway chaperone
MNQINWWELEKIKEDLKGLVDWLDSEDTRRASIQTLISIVEEVYNEQNNLS